MPQISERHAPMHDSQALIDDVAAMAHIGGWQLDAATRTTHWSREVYRIHEVEPGNGMPLAEALGFYSPEGRALITNAVRRALEEGTPYDLILPLVTAQGNRRWVRTVGHAVREAGVITQLRGAFQDITTTHETQQRLARASRASAEGHWEFEFTTQTVWLSASLQELLGFEPRDRTCTRAEFWSMLEAEDVVRAQRMLTRHIASGAPYDLELRMHCAGGACRWFRSRATAELDARGQPLRVGGSIIDIDAEKRAREELETLRRRYERALNGTQDGLWDWNLRTSECWVSPRFLELLGHGRDDAAALDGTAEAFLALVHPEDLPRLTAETQLHFATGQSYDIELRLRTRDGSWRWFRSRGRAERDAAGVPIAMAGSVQDIEQQKQAELERAEAKRRLARAIEGSTDALYEMDLSRPGPTWYSPRMREMLAYGPDEPFPDTVRLLMSQEDRERMDRAVKEYERSGLPFEFVFSLPTKHGERRWFRSRGRTERDASGAPLRISGSIQDITAQRAAEIALRAATEAADAANRAKGEFLANMSHEIRTPLSGVLGMTELLLEGPLEPAQREYAETIRASGSALLAIINDILDLSKIEAGKLTLEQLPMDLHECLREASAILEPQARKRGLRLRTEVAPDVPVRVRGDPLRLRQILLNLASNALKFTPAGEVRLCVELAERDADTAVLQFEVSDTGIGMDAATIGRLFTPFTQADASTTRHYGGTGLGLSIVKRLLEQMGGSIGVRSTPGAGTTFDFRWPCRVLATESPGTSRAAAPVAPGTPAAVRGRVLVVEDHAVNQMILRRQLERFGCSVSIAEDGARGVELALGDHFDLILMDVQMPILDGLAATRRIRSAERDGKHVPIIAATASAMTDEIERCREAGMDDLLTKPIDRAKLHLLLARYLPASESEPNDVTIDTMRLKAMIHDDREFAARLSAIFLDSTREMLAAIEAASAARDRALLSTLAHKLLGAAHSAGATELGNIARRLEQQAPLASEETLAALGVALHRAYAATVQSFDRLGLGEHIA